MDDPRPYLFELSGEHPTMPLAELEATVRAEHGPPETLISGPGYAVVSLTPISFEKVISRLALTHRAGEFLGTYDIGANIPMPELPDGTIAVRVRRYSDRDGVWDVDSVTRRIGDVVTVGRKVDLRNPDIEIRGIASDRLLLHRKLKEVDRKAFDLRRVAERPYFSPISLHPRYARALLNMCGLRAGDAVLDPFCGTGGLLLEASLLGMRTFGSDISPAMIDGCRRNLEHFGLRAERLEVMDIERIADSFGPLDGIVTDPPYGRAASTSKEAIGSLYARAMTSMRDTLRPGGVLGVLFPMDVAIPEGMTLEQRHHQKVHRSLTRQYSIIRRH